MTLDKTEKLGKLILLGIIFLCTVTKLHSEKKKQQLATLVDDGLSKTQTPGKKYVSLTQRKSKLRF